MKFETLTAPAIWASYLINRDPSGLSEAELDHADHWLKSNGVVNVVDCDHESRFTWHYRLYDTLADCGGGNVHDYTVELMSTR